MPKKYNNVTDIRGLLADLCDLALRPENLGGAPGREKWNPCSYLIAKLTRYGADDLAKKILFNSSYEYRLNGAGLKLYTKSEDGVLYRATVAGDQACEYPNFVREANAALFAKGLQDD